jgi:hypothetical protein
MVLETERRSAMEQHREKPKTPKPRTEEKPKRFRFIKLEERISPSFARSASGCTTSNCGTRV